VEIGADEASDSLKRTQDFILKAEAVMNNIIKDFLAGNPQ
jgi:hypothetical protein